MPLLQWILFSKRPLSREELYIAIQCVDGALSEDSHLKLALSTKNIDKFILDSSKGLAEMTRGKKPRVQFIHELVRTHFLDDEGLANLEPALRTNMVAKSHDQLKRCCFAYLSTEPCAQMQLPTLLPDVGSQEHKELRQSTINTLPFLQYVIMNALHHANEAHDGGVDQQDLVGSFDLAVWKKLHNVLAKYKKHQHSESFSLAHVFASRGLAKLLEIALETLSIPDLAAHEWYHRLLTAALQSKDFQSIRVILDKVPSECYRSKDNGSLVYRATCDSDLETVKALLEAKLKPFNPRAISREQTAIAVAASKPDDFGSELGRFGLLRLLIGHISDADAKNKHCQFALTMALGKVCRKGDVDMSKELLAKGANASDTHTGLPSLKLALQAIKLWYFY